MKSSFQKALIHFRSFLGRAFETICQYSSVLKAIIRWPILVTFSKVSDWEENVPSSSTTIKGPDRKSVSDHIVDGSENVVEWTLSTGRYDVDKPILIDASCPSRFVTKREALKLVASLAGAFRPDSTVCLHLPNDVLYPVLILGILASKCAWTGTNIAYTSFELEHHFRTSVTRYVVTLPEHLKIVESATKGLDSPVEIILFTDILTANSLVKVQYEDAIQESEHSQLFMNGSSELNARRTLHDLLGDPGLESLKCKMQSIRPDHTAALQSTSGTTGFPKIAARTHRSLILESKAIEDNTAAKPYEVRRLFCTPIFHAFSTPEMVITPLRLGIPTYIMRRYDDTFAKKIHDFGITETVAPPPMLKMLQEQEGAHHLLQGLCMIFCGGAPLMPELRNRVLAIFETAPRIAQVWGMTEGGWFSTFRYPEDDATGSVGRMIPGFQIKMSTDHSLEASNGRKAGELLVQGSQLMTEYFGNEQASKDAFVDGWLKTGDVGYIEDGKVYIVDRCKDLIKVNGWQVAPAEIEAAIMDLPGIQDAAAISAGCGVDEHPLLFIVKSHGADVSREAVMNHLRSRMAKHKVARTVAEFIESVPRNPSGKILRRLLRAKAIENGLMECK